MNDTPKHNARQQQLERELNEAQLLLKQFRRQQRIRTNIFDGTLKLTFLAAMGTLAGTSADATDWLTGSCAATTAMSGFAQLVSSKAAGEAFTAATIARTLVGDIVRAMSEATAEPTAQDVSDLQSRRLDVEARYGNTSIAPDSPTG